MTTTGHPAASFVRAPAVAGFFYPADAAELDRSVRSYLAEAEAKVAPRAKGVPKAIIAPHAGYVYSGLTAAAAYRTVAPARGTIRRVVMMGPCHRVAVRGIALSSAAAFRSPLGDVPVDLAAVEKIKGLPGVQVFDQTHKHDHALEVHLPFLQVVLGDISIVPMIVGQANPDDVARVIETLWGGAETLILISSDLSHYLPYEAARGLDAATSRAIETLDSQALRDDQACGRHSIKGLLEVARTRRLTVATADVRNSGDTAGTKDRVVGYGSWLFFENAGAQKPEKRAGTRKVIDVRHPVRPRPAAKPEAESETRALLDRHGATLLRHAANAILAVLKVPLTPVDSAPAGELTALGATFVTLEKNGKLRGCIGSIAPHRPLLDDIAENARRAAFGDPRFPKLTLDEIKAGRIDIHISVLGLQTPMRFSSEADLVAQIRPKRDGLVLQDQGRRGVFLPSVWESLPDAKTFLNHLKRKAGLPESHWSDTVQVWRYTTEEIRSEHMGPGFKLWALS